MCEKGINSSPFYIFSFLRHVFSYPGIPRTMEAMGHEAWKIMGKHGEKKFECRRDYLYPERW
jgi:hypothetical protein